MTIGDSLHYYTVGNGLSKKVIGTVSSILHRPPKPNTPTVNASTVANVSNAVTHATPRLWQIAGFHRHFIRLAGLSGASAVVIGAIGSHSFELSSQSDSKRIFETANRFHFFHSLALLGIPLTKYPLASGTLITTGMLFFCGTLYCRAFFNHRKFTNLAPFGGCCLILGWLSLML